MPSQSNATNGTEVLRLLNKALRWTREANTDETLRAAIALLDDTDLREEKLDPSKRPRRRSAAKKKTTTKTR